MPIVRKTTVLRHIEDLETRLEDLKKAISGNNSEHANWDQHSLSVDDFRRDFVYIEPDDLDYAITNMRSQINVANKLKKHKEAPLHKGR